MRRDAIPAGSRHPRGLLWRTEYAPPPPPEVTVALPVQQEVTTYNEVTGRTASIEAVEVRARVQGFLQSMHFTPGTEVKQGDPLFVIEPSLYQARVDQAAADLQSAQAQSEAASEQLEIAQAIFERNAGSKTDLVQKTQARDQARAAVAQAKANLEAAKLDLSYTHIYAPNSGRIDRNYVDVGNLVGAGEATLLASIVRQDPILLGRVKSTCLCCCHGIKLHLTPSLYPLVKSCQPYTLLSTRCSGVGGSPPKQSKRNRGSREPPSPSSAGSTRPVCRS